MSRMISAKRFVPIAAGLLSAATLVACGEAGTGGGPTAADNHYSALYDQTISLRDEFGRTTAGIWSPNPSTSAGGVLAQTGTANYVGTTVIRLPTVPNTTILGDAYLTANFDTNRVSGQMNNFVGAEGNVETGPARIWNGSLGLGNSAINTTVGAAHHVSAPVSGSLTAGTDQLDVNGTLQGNFLNDDASYAAQAFSGSLTAGSTLRLNGLNHTPGGTNGMSILLERRGDIAP